MSLDPSQPTVETHFTMDSDDLFLQFLRTLYSHAPGGNNRTNIMGAIWRMGHAETSIHIPNPSPAPMDPTWSDQMTAKFQAIADEIDAR